MELGSWQSSTLDCSLRRFSVSGLSIIALFYTFVDCILLVSTLFFNWFFLFERARIRIMWMKRNSTTSQLGGLADSTEPTLTQRNFLRENKLLVRRATLSRRHGQPDAVTSRHRCTLQAQQRCRQHSEKQIQTEDISDEQFLNAALLKCCTEHVRGSQTQLLRGCSEGDEPQLYVPCANIERNRPLRRTASNFELGTMPAQRSSYQSVPYTLHRSTCAAVLGRTCMDVGTTVASEQMNEDATPTLHVLQLAIPEITDVETNPQLDQPLSTRTNASCSSHTSKRSSSSTSSTDNPPVEQANQTNELTPKLERHTDQILLTELQRMQLLEAAQARHRELIWQYNRLPLSMNTLRVRNLKIQLEQQLDRIDIDMTWLNLPQVYVSRDQLQQIPSISC